MLGIIVRVVRWGHIANRIHIMDVDVTPTGCQETQLNQSTVWRNPLPPSFLENDLYLYFQSQFSFIWHYFYLLSKQINSEFAIKEANKCAIFNLPNHLFSLEVAFFLKANPMIWCTGQAAGHHGSATTDHHVTRHVSALVPISAHWLFSSVEWCSAVILMCLKDLAGRYLHNSMGNHSLRFFRF